MDIIASHRHGLIELLQAEAGGLAGRSGDVAQRAAAWHHLYQHSGGNFGLGLLAALDAVARPARAVWRWRSRAMREAQALALGAARERDRKAFAQAYFAYRLSAMPALRGDAEERLGPALLGALDRMHAHRRAGRLALVGERRALLEAACDWLDADSAAERLAAFDRIEQRGWQRAEAGLKADRAMPRGFAGNPAQHFFAIQRAIAERRRSRHGGWAEIDGDDSVRLAA